MILKLHKKITTNSQIYRGNKRRKQTRIAQIYDEYHQVISKNKELLNKFRDTIVIDYMQNLKAN